MSDNIAIQEMIAFWTWMVVVFAHTMNGLNATELYS